MADPVRTLIRKVNQTSVLGLSAKERVPERGWGAFPLLSVASLRPPS